MAEAKATEWEAVNLADPDAVTLEVGGQKLALSSVALSYTVNQVPEAVCTLSVGRTAGATADELGATHEQVAALPTGAPALVKLKLRKTNAANAAAGGQPFAAVTVFEGQLHGFSRQHQNGRTRYVASLRHWLSNLAHGSALNQTAHVGTPLNLMMPGVMAASGASDRSLVINGETVAPGLAGALAGDVWTGIQTVLLKLLEKNANNPVATDLGISLQGAGSGAIARAKTAVEKIVSGAPIPMVSALQRFNTTIARALSQAINNNITNTTLWDMMVALYLVPMRLVLCPTAAKAYVIPDVPAWRSESSITIAAKDYTYIDTHGFRQRPLRAVIMTGLMSNWSGAGRTSDGQDPPPKAEVFGGATATAADVSAADGLILYQRTPYWLTDAVYGEYKTDPTATQKAGENTATSTTTPVPSSGVAQPPPATRADNFKAAGKLLAEDVMAAYNLQGRAGTLAGRLRFDIAPGSLVRIEVTGELFEKKAPPAWHARVARVTIVLDAETQNATTSFMLTHMRTDDENKNPSYSTPNSYIYNYNGPTGFPLIPELKDF